MWKVPKKISYLCSKALVRVMMEKIQVSRRDVLSLLRKVLPGYNFGVFYEAH